MVGIHVAIYPIAAIVPDKREPAKEFHGDVPQSSLGPDIIKVSNLHRAMTIATYNLYSPCLLQGLNHQWDIKCVVIPDVMMNLH